MTNPKSVVHRLITLELIDKAIEQCETEIVMSRQHAEQAFFRLTSDLFNRAAGALYDLELAKLADLELAKVARHVARLGELTRARGYLVEVFANADNQPPGV